jgi:5-methyltetrahydrofolate--homocysteine methyltransferase
VLATVKGDVHNIGKNIVGVVLGCNNYEVIDLGVMVPCERILQAARDSRADMIGLSGLITPSLDEMVHVAREMERQHLQIPLLIGGATTSAVHTAVKIAACCRNPVVHVTDASRAASAAANLVNPALNPAFVAQNSMDQDSLREAHLGKTRQRALLSLEQARKHRLHIDWTTGEIPKPTFLGVRNLGDFPLAAIVPYIDWTPFFHAWEMKGRYPEILDDPISGPRARDLYGDAQKLLERIVAEKLLSAHGVYGFFPANSRNDDILVFSDESRTEIRTVFHMLRQQTSKPDGQSNLAMADFIAPCDSGIKDYLGAFAVSSGFGAEGLFELFKHENDDYHAIMAEALADRLAEAFAELLHKRIREEWGYGLAENLTPEDLIHARYRGIRPAPGYPACPDHTEKGLLFDLLQVEDLTGIRLTENYAMWPPSSVSGFFLAHPESRYFALGKIGRDQVADYAERKKMSISQVERWLAPNLSYDPDQAD